MDENLRQQFFDELKTYLSEDELNVDSVANSFGEMILRYVDADPESIVQALHAVNAEKLSGFPTKNEKPFVEVQLPNSNILLTCYFSGEMPLLRFYNGNRKQLLFKIDKERQKKGGILFSALYETDNVQGEKSEKNSQKYILTNRKVGFEKTHTLSVANGEDKAPFDIDSIEEGDKQFFYKIVDIIMKNSSVPFDEEMSKESADILLNVFYENAKKILSFPEELSVNEVLRVLTEIFYKSEDLSKLTENLARSDEFYSNDGTKLDLRVNGSEKLNLQKADDLEYYNIYAINPNRELSTKYMIFKTTEGFTIHRKYMGELSEIDREFPSYTIGISGNMIKIAVLGTDSIRSPLEITVRFNKSGIEYTEIENLVFEDTSFAKRPIPSVLGE